MSRLKILLFCVVLLFAQGLSSKPKDKKAQFVYDINFEMNFDNREYYKSDFSRSMTIFASRLSPLVGVEFGQNKSVKQRVLAGVDLMKDFGSSKGRPYFREMTFFYNLDRKFGDMNLTLVAGVFPRSFLMGDYSPAFFSDSLTFYDNNLEGLYLKFSKKKSFYELGCDWFSQYGEYSREKFMIYFAGNTHINNYLSFAYSAYVLHFARSEKADGVMDNILVNPHLDLDLSTILNFQEFKISLGWLQAFQQDRLNVGHYVFPSGGELKFNASKWNVGLENSLFLGTDMMPYYNSKDITGVKYGPNLYLGDPFYRVFDSPSVNVSQGDSAIKKLGIYNRLELYYEPRIAKNLNLKISAIFHFNDGYSGCQQMIGLNYSLF